MTATIDSLGRRAYGGSDAQDHLIAVCDTDILVATPVGRSARARGR